jgi:hypothetical protein
MTQPDVQAITTGPRGGLVGPVRQVQMLSCRR